MPEELDRAGRSALHYAAVDKQPDRVRELLAAGADPDLADRRGFRPLHFAAQSLHAGIVRQLLDAGAEVDPQEVFGKTPLLTAVSNSGHDGVGDEVVRLLLDAGADPDLPNRAGISARSLAETVSNFDLMRFFRD